MIWSSAISHISRYIEYIEHTQYIAQPNLNKRALSKIQKTEPDCVLTGVGDSSSPAQAVKTDRCALRKAVSLEGHPPKILDGPHGDSSISLWEWKRISSNH